MILKNEITTEDYQRAVSGMKKYELDCADLYNFHGLTADVIVTPEEFKNIYETGIEVDSRIFEWVLGMIESQKKAEIEYQKYLIQWQKECAERESKIIRRNGKEYILDESRHEQGMH